MVQEKVNTVFLHLEAEEFTAEAPVLSSGWEIAFPSGKTVMRSTLQAEAQPLIDLGPEAIPYLLPRVMDDNLPLRYVAIYALEQITGEKPYVPYFAQDDAEGYRANAIEVWQAWYEAQTK